MNGYGTSIGGSRRTTRGWHAVADVATVEWDDVAASRPCSGRGGSIAAFIGEPVIGSGGVFPPPEGYWPAIARSAHAMTCC